MPAKRPDSFFKWSVLLVLAFIWGSSFILMKIGLREIPFQELGALRMTIAFLFLIPFGIRAWSTMPAKYWKYFLIVGMCGNCVPAFLFAFAQTYIDSSLAGMLNSLVPIFTLLLGLIFFKISTKKIHIAGVIFGFAGASFILYKPGMSFDSNSIYGLFIVVSTICYGISVNVIKKYLSDVSSAVITSTSLLLVGPFCGIFLLFTGFPGRISLSRDFLISFGAITLLSVLGTGFAIILFNMLIKRVSALYATSVTYLIPLVAILWGLLDGEIVQPIQFAGMAAILTGIYLINK